MTSRVMVFFVLFAFGCPHHHTPAENTLVAIHSAAHAVAVTDGVMARHCGVASPAPECGRFVDAYAVTRAALATAETAVSAWRAADTAPARCRAYAALGEANDAVAAVSLLLAAAHVPVPAELTAAAVVVVDAVRSLAPSCAAGDGGTT